MPTKKTTDAKATTSSKKTSATSSKSSSKKSTSSKTSTSKTTRKTTSKSSSTKNAKRVVDAVLDYDTSKSFSDNRDVVSNIISASAKSASKSATTAGKGFYTFICVLLVVAVAVTAIYGYFNNWYELPFTPEEEHYNSQGGGENGGNQGGGNQSESGNQGGEQGEGGGSQGSGESGEVVVNGDLQIHFLELGNKFTGDCVYIKAGDVDMLIDAGSENSSAPTLINYLDQYITDNKIEYVIATHAHTDHIGAFYSTGSREGIFEHYQTGTIIDFSRSEKTYNGAVPSDSTVIGKYFKYRDLEVQQGATHYTAEQCFNETDGASRSYQLTENISFEILYNYYYFNYELSKNGNIVSGENNYSVCCMIHQGDNKYLFTGDLEGEGTDGAEQKMVTYYENERQEKGLSESLLANCVLYKAGHHGSKTSTSKELMAVVKPQYCCVCCCCGTSEYTDENINQFPTQQFIDNIAPYTDEVYVTTMVDNYVSMSEWKTSAGGASVKSMNGNIVFSCNDGEISIVCSNNNTKLKNTDWFKTNRTCPEAWKDDD